MTHADSRRQQYAYINFVHNQHSIIIAAIHHHHNLIEILISQKALQRANKKKHFVTETICITLLIK